jgi:RNA polymerase sigma-70 factor (ECF subfamily)
VVRSLARPNVEKRRSLSWDARHNTECILKKAAPPVSTITTDKLSEADLIQRAREGDRAAFEYLYHSHGKRVSAVCFRMLGNTTDAEDLTQEAFLLLFRKIHTFRGESAFSTWLHRLVVNLVLMHLRKKSLPAVSMQAAADPEGEPAPSCFDIPTSDLSLEGLLDRINLERCIAQLPPGCRTVFVLHDIEGYQHHEIAQILGRSEGLSKSQLSRAHRHLRKLLHERQPEKDHGERQAARKTTAMTRAQLDLVREDRPIATCAAQRKAFMPILQT